MVKLRGIHLVADSIEELHHFAGKIVVGKSWFHSTPFPHYDLICPHKIERALIAIEKIEKKKDRIKAEVHDIFQNYLK